MGPVRSALRSTPYGGCDREVTSRVAVANAGINGDMVRNMILDGVGRYQNFLCASRIVNLVPSFESRSGHRILSATAHERRWTAFMPGSRTSSMNPIATATLMAASRSKVEA